MRNLVFRGPNCVFICCVELKVAVTVACAISLHADSYCNVLVREISGFSRGVVKVLETT